jgi:hypothetical protein
MQLKVQDSLGQKALADPFGEQYTSLKARILLFPGFYHFPYGLPSELCFRSSDKFQQPQSTGWGDTFDSSCHAYTLRTGNIEYP